MIQKYTRHQVPRGTRPDAEVADRLYLIKNVSVLRATYQVRLLAYRAGQSGKKLVIRMPRSAKLARDLTELRREHGKTIVIERV